MNYFLQDMEDLIQVWGETDDASPAGASAMGNTNVKKLAEIFVHLVEMEMNFYKSS